MSRSNPTDGVRNPSTRWFEWSGGDDGGFVRWYNKESETTEKGQGAFTFLLLDELSTIKGWHDPSGSSIYANEVRDTRQDVFVVRSFKGGEIASGIYANIRDRVKAYGGHYCASIYIAIKEGSDLRIANLSLKGAAAGAWMEFKRSAPTKKNEDGKSLKAYFVDAIKIDGYEQLKKGSTVYRIPKFSLVPVSESTNHQAVALDTELQTFLSDYLKRPKASTAPPAPTTDDVENDAPFDSRPAARDELDEDIPF